MSGVSSMIRFSKVNKWYGEYQALVDITAEVKRGEVVVVCGPSGSGKSTLIRTVNRLEEIDGGNISFDDQDIHEKKVSLNAFRSKVGFVFQQFNLFPHLSVLDNITLSPMRVRGMKRAVAERKAAALLSRVGLGNQAQALPGPFY